MSSEAAQKAYPEDEWSAGANAIAREAFDAGAVEALRQAAARYRDAPLEDFTDATLDRMADEWEAGQ